MTDEFEKQAISERWQLDYRTLEGPYVTPANLEWAITRDKNMQRIARQLIEELSAAEARAEKAEALLRDVVQECSEFCCICKDYTSKPEDHYVNCPIAKAIKLLSPKESDAPKS